MYRTVPWGASAVSVAACAARSAPAAAAGSSAANASAARRAVDRVMLACGMIGRRTCDEPRVMSSFPDRLHALLYPRAYPHAVRAVDLIETHISWVLLTGKFAYKVKRPVHYPFIDLRSPEQRRLLCHEEVRLNRRFAPELYLGVRAIRRRRGEARIGGSGHIIEHAVKMRQFPRSHELDALLGARRIVPVELEAFGGELADMHERLPVAQAAHEWGRPAAQVAGIRRNAAECVR